MSTTEKPRDSKPFAAFDAALASYRQGDARKAYEACMGILESEPSHSAAHLAGVIAFEQGHHEVATELLRNAISIAPGRAGYYCDLALPLRALEKYAEALSALEQALDIDAELLPALNIKASLLSFLGRGQAAAETLERLTRLQADDASVHLRLGLARRNIGDLDGARLSLEKAIALQPDLSSAYWVLSTLQTASESGNHIGRMEKLLAAAGDPNAQVELSFALAKEYEDLREFDSAFEHLARGNRLRRAQVIYDAARERERFREIAETFSAGFMKSRWPGSDAEPGPVFIVGMPRTGSTLLERMLAGHSRVGSAGELQVVESLVLQQERSRNMKFPRLAEALDQDELRSIGLAYLDKSRPFRDASPVFIDKMPMNFLYAGLIALMLPAARVISIRRDPMDTCFSCYKQLFGAQYRFSYDLRELADYYRLYDGLVCHWHSVLPGRIIDLHYEDLVSEPERETRRVLAFCNLDWEPGCLDFQRAAGAVQTPSAVQVREAPHQRSVGRWRSYQSHLSALIDALSD